MAKTFSKSANNFIDSNSKTTIAEFAVNMAVQDVLSAVSETLIELCPHKDVCNKKCNGCRYLDKYIKTIKLNKNLCFNLDVKQPSRSNNGRFISKKATQSTDYVIINGLKWDRENLVINGQTHYTQDEGIAAAANAGKRLPTCEEFKALVALGHQWDSIKKGMWFGRDSHLKSKSKESIFFPASGRRYGASGAFSLVGSSGYYWSGSVAGTNGYYLSFYSTNVNPANYSSRANGFPVRCLQK